MRECARDDKYRWSALSHFHNFALDALAKGGLIELVVRLLALIAPPAVFFMRAMRVDTVEPVRNPVLVLTVLMAATFLLSGSFGIFLGHDIADALYLYTMVSLCCISMNSVGGSHPIRIETT